VSEFRDRRVLVVGLAQSGLAAVRVLRDLGAVVSVTEVRPTDEVVDAASAAEDAGAEVFAGGHAPEHLDGADLVITSPGVPEGADILRWALKKRLPIWSELELGARVAMTPYIAVTGTNGKTTTTEMIAAILRADGRDAVACGNVGLPFSTAALQTHEVLVVEASSFQLRFHESFHPRVSVLLNLAPDHLDWHGSFSAYRDAKARVFALQQEDDTHVGNRDDPHAAPVSREASCRLVWFTLADPRPGEVGYAGEDMVLRLHGEQVIGRPNAQTDTMRVDAAAAAAAAVSFGADPASAGAALSGFEALPHRGAVVAEVAGVRFIDDSKATNPHAALAALSGLTDVVLVAGGRSKGVDLTPLAAATGRLRGVVAIGEAAPELVALFQGDVPVRTASTMEAAVEEGFRMARPQGVVLLAPACASQDMFRDYQERGERFSVAARALVAQAGTDATPRSEGRRAARG
jgi:UDP-N-acetylmuramoylalanine--D-glutamate ligase